MMGEPLVFGARERSIRRRREQQHAGELTAPVREVEQLSCELRRVRFPVAQLRAPLQLVEDHQDRLERVAADLRELASERRDKPVAGAALVTAELPLVGLRREPLEVLAQWRLPHPIHVALPDVLVDGAETVELVADGLPA